MQHWANRHQLVYKSAQNVEDMQAALQRVVSSVSVAKLNSNNLVHKEAFTSVIDTSEDWRQKLAELLMKQGEETRKRVNVEEAAKLFQKAIAARGTELCADVKVVRDRVIEMRRALLEVRGGGEVEGNNDMEQAAWSKMRLADDLKNQGEYEEAIKLYEEECDAEVAHRLSYFPLALASAAGCASKYELNTRQYLDELGKEKSSLYLQKWQGRKKKLNREYMSECSDVVQMTWARLERSEDAAAVRELLRELAVLDPNNIPLSLFDGFQLLPPTLKEHCLVHVQQGPTELVSIHALTQEVICEHLMGDDRPGSRP